MAERPDPRGSGAPGGAGEQPGHVRDLDGAHGELRSALDSLTGAAEPRPGAGAGGLRQRIAADPDSVERDLVKLVLTVVELVRQLMERQALRRVDQGDLSEEQEERIGMTLMLLEERMTELRDRYGLSAADLNLDLGPLGTLLPKPE